LVIDSLIFAHASILILLGNKIYILLIWAGGLVTCLNNNDKSVIDLLRRRMETHPDKPMHYYGTPYTPTQMIDEIKRGTSVGKEVVRAQLEMYTNMDYKHTR